MLTDHFAKKDNMDDTIPPEPLEDPNETPLDVERWRSFRYRELMAERAEWLAIGHCGPAVRCTRLAWCRHPFANTRTTRIA